MSAWGSNTQVHWLSTVLAVEDPPSELLPEETRKEGNKDHFCFFGGSPVFTFTSEVIWHLAHSSALQCSTNSFPCFLLYHSGHSPPKGGPSTPSLLPQNSLPPRHSLPPDQASWTWAPGPSQRVSSPADSALRLLSTRSGYSPRIKVLGLFSQFQSPEHPSGA